MGNELRFRNARVVRVMAVCVAITFLIVPANLVYAPSTLTMPDSSKATVNSVRSAASYLEIADDSLDFLWPLWNTSGSGYAGYWAKDYIPAIRGPVTTWASSTTGGYPVTYAVDNATGTRWIGVAGAGSWTVYQNYTREVTFFQMRLFANFYGSIDGTIWEIKTYYSPDGSDWTLFETLNRTMSEDDIGRPITDRAYNRAWGYVDMYFAYPGFISGQYFKLEAKAWGGTARFGLWEWGFYENTVETWVSSWALSSYAIKAGHSLANATEKTRALSIFDSLTDEDYWDRSGTREPITHAWHYTTLGRHSAATYGAMEGIYYAWKYRTELGLSSAQIATAKTCANATTYFHNQIITHPSYHLQTFMWQWACFRMAYEMTGNVTLVERFEDALDFKFSEPYWSEAFAPDWTFKYMPTTYHRFHAPEYSAIMYGGLANIPIMQAGGVRSLTDEELAKINGWQQSVLLRFSPAGILNLNSDNGYPRMYGVQYTLWAIRSLITMMAVPDYNLQTDDVNYAKSIFDGFSDWWLANDNAWNPTTDSAGRGIYMRDPIDGVPPVQFVTVSKQTPATYDQDKAVCAAMYAHIILLAYDDNLLDISSQEIDGWAVWHRDRAELAVSTTEYHTAIITNNYWIGYDKAETQWCGISTHKLFDGDGIPVFELGIDQNLSQSFTIGNPAVQTHSISGYNGTYSLDTVSWNGLDLTAVDDYSSALLPRHLDYIHVAADHPANVSAYTLSTDYWFYDMGFVSTEKVSYSGGTDMDDAYVVKYLPLRNWSLVGVYVGLASGSEMTILDDDTVQQKSGLADVRYIRIEYQLGKNLYLYALSLTNGTGAHIEAYHPWFGSTDTDYTQNKRYTVFQNYTLAIYLAESTSLDQDYEMTFLWSFQEPTDCSLTANIGQNHYISNGQNAYHDRGTQTGITANPNVGYARLNVSTWNQTSDIVAGWETDTTSTVTYTLAGLRYDVGYKVYQDGEEIFRSHSGHSSFSFTAVGGGEFEVKVWDPYQIWEDASQYVFYAGFAFMLCAIIIALAGRYRR